MHISEHIALKRRTRTVTRIMTSLSYVNVFFLHLLSDILQNEKSLFIFKKFSQTYFTFPFFCPLTIKIKKNPFIAVVLFFMSDSFCRESYYILTVLPRGFYLCVCYHVVCIRVCHLLMRNLFKSWQKVRVQSTH